MLVIAGLGNPGTSYANNRHNIGFMAVDSIHDTYRFSPWRSKFHALVSDGTINGEKILLVKPQTYMNNSGQALAAIMQFYKLSLQDIIVFHDELDLTPEKVRIKTGGSAGGHNGIKSIDAHCGKDYRRIRLGIGHPGHGKDLVHNHVMGNFSKAEMHWLEPLLQALAQEISYVVAGDASTFMNKVVTNTHPANAENGHIKAKNQKAVAAKSKSITKSLSNKDQLSHYKDDEKNTAGPMAETLKKLLNKE